MATIIIPRKHLAQPQGRVALAPEFDDATLAFSNAPIDCARSRPLPLTPLVGPNGVHLTNGGVIATLGAANDWLPIGPQVTVLLGGSVRSGTDSPVFTTDSASTNAANVYLPYSDGNLYWRWGGEVAGSSSLSVGGLSFSEADMWALTAGPRGMEVWKNGTRVAYQSGSASRTADTTQLRLGYFVGAATVANLSLSMLAVLPRQLDTNFLASRRYFSIFRADPIRIYSFPSGPISVTINSITASNITSSGARITLGLTR